MYKKIKCLLTTLQVAIALLASAIFIKRIIRKEDTESLHLPFAIIMLATVNSLKDWFCIKSD